MTDNSQKPRPDLAPDEATVLDLFKTIFKDWRSFVVFVAAIFDAAKREQINQSLAIQQASIQEAEQPRRSFIGSTNFPWRSLLGSFLAILAQFLLEPPGIMLSVGSFQIQREGRNFPLAAGFYMLAFVLIFWGVQKREWKLAPLLPDHKGGDPATVRVTPFIVSILFSFIAFLAFVGNLFTLFNVIIWLFAICTYIYSLWLSYSQIRQPLSKEERLELLKRIILLILVAVCVIFFRVYRLGEVPSEPFSDHAEKILDIFDITQGETHIFFTRNTGREGLQMYWTVLINWIFGTGLSFLSLKIGAVLFGLFTLPFVYLLGREVGGNRVGLFATAFTGIGYWPNVISRVGLRFPLYPLFVAPALFYLIRGLRTRNRNDFILSGLSLGLGLHGYSPIRILPFLIVVAIGLYLIHRQSIGARRDAVLWLAVLGFSALIIFLPLLRYSMDNPLIFSYRAFSRVGSIQKPLPGPGLLVFFSNLWNALRMFNWDDGVIWVNSIAKRPALDVVSGALFLIGVMLVLIRYVRQRHWLDLFLLLSIPILQLPSILSLAFPGENPALNRASGAYIPAFLLVALALDGLLAALGSGKVRTILAWSLGATLFLLSGIQNYDLVFRQFANQYNSHAWNSSEMGAEIKDFRDTYGTTDTVWIVPFPHWVDTRLPSIWVGIPNQDFALWRDNLGITVEFQGPKLFLVKANLSEPTANDQETLDVLMNLYPQGILELHQSEVIGHDFWVFFVPDQ
jgi:hypothetical protein